MRSKREIRRQLKAKIKALKSYKIKNDFLLNDLKNLKTELYYLRKY